MPNSDPWDRFVDPYLTLISDSYNLLFIGSISFKSKVFFLKFEREVRGHFKVHLKHPFYAPAIRRMRKGIKRCPCPCVCPCVPSVSPSVRPSFKWVLCEHNSSYNFIPILLKLYRCFCQGLKMCMTFGYNPQINFCHFFHSLNLVIFGLSYYRSLWTSGTL